MVNDYRTEYFGTQQQERWRCLDDSVVFGVVTTEKGGVQKISLEICMWMPSASDSWLPQTQIINAPQQRKHAWACQTSSNSKG